ncbi:hypothetical protein [Streptomyces sp. AC495_CC817]|uniref:hypothetical protein n=1 Tax=Streptomyces sp. AC495_CC817 TaxID=2823900 RepID=UPI0020B6958B|nr:hypothetical protein [Streptomyces sp. AC495_CC817]
MLSSLPLLAADHRAGIVYEIDDAHRRVAVADVWLAEHAGILRLPSLPSGAPDRWAFADDRGGALVVAGADAVRRIPVAIPAEHLACDPSGRYVVVTTGLGMNEEPWSDLVSVVDLATDSSVRFRVRTGEPGVVVVPDQSSGAPMIVLRHREPGALESLPLSDALATGPHAPVLRGALLDDLAPDGHGDVVDPSTGILGVATSRGLERFVVHGGLPRAIGVVPWPAAGRAYYLRLAGDTGRVTGIVRGGPSDPGAWPEWTNTFVEIDLATGASAAVPLPPGLAFRFALGTGTAAVSVIHPAGDTVVVVDRESSRISRTVPIPPMSHPPLPGRMPWDAVDGRAAQRRAIAIDPQSSTIAVTSGGDGAIHLIDADDGISTVVLDTPLDEGGHLLWADGGERIDDLVGR